MISLLALNPLTPFYSFSFCHFFFFLSLTSFTPSLFVSITPPVPLPLIPLSLKIPLPLFLIPLLSLEHFFLFLSTTSVSLLSLSILVWNSLRSQLSLFVSFLPFSHLISLFFFSLADKIYVCPPTPHSHVRTHAKTHRCTHPLLSFCPSYLDLYQPRSSGPMPALLRGTQLSGEKRGAKPKAQPP